MCRCLSSTVRRCASLGCAVNTSSMLDRRTTSFQPLARQRPRDHAELVRERARLRPPLARVVAPPARAVVLLGEVHELGK